MESLWSQTVRLPEGKILDADLRAKNVVIGAGMAGILIAYFLQEQGQEVIILESDKIAGGETKNTTAKITSQHGLIYYDMINNCGREKARVYAEANETAIQLYRELITKEGISCHFEEMPSFLYTKKEEGVQKLKREAEAASSCGIDAEYVRGDKITELPFGVAGAVKFSNQAQFHPLEFINGIAKKLEIYEHAKVLEVDERFVITDRHVIVADNVIFAVHYPFPIIPGYYFLRQHQSRSHVLALEGKSVPEKWNGMYYGIDRDGLSFRCANEKLILGGSSHRTGKHFQTDTKGSKVRYSGAFCHLREQAKKYYPDAVEIAHWSAQDCMPHDRIPFIGMFTKKHENWYVATGFQKWGMTSAMISAVIISGMILEKEGILHGGFSQNGKVGELIAKKNVWEKVFTPQRFLLKAGYKNFVIDMWETIIGLSSGLWKKKEEKCSHMGCALHWNEEEQSWDCACHGSRFSKEGEVLDNPADRGLKE